MKILGTFPDVWALLAVLVAFVVTVVLAVLQHRGKAVWSWAWFAPGVLVLVYWLVALWLKLTEFRDVLGVGYIDDTNTIYWLRQDFPWAAGVSGLLFALSAVLVSFRGRVESWRAARGVVVTAVLGALVFGGVLSWRLFLSNELSMEESSKLLYESRVGLWAAVFLMVFVACIRGTAGGLSRERAVLLGGLSISAGAMIVQACVVPAAYRAMFLLYAHSRARSMEGMWLGRALQNNLSEGVWLEVLLTFVCIAVCVALLLRKSAARVARVARRDVVMLLVLGTLVTGLMGAVVLKTGEVRKLYGKEVQRDLLGPLPHSSDDYIVPWSTTFFDNETSGLGIIIGRKSLDVVSYFGISRRPTEKPATIAFTHGEAFPDALGARIRAEIENRKEQAAVYSGTYEPSMVVAADQLTDYQTVYALIAYVFQGDFDVNYFRLLVRRYHERSRGVTDGMILAMIHFPVRQDLALDAEHDERRLKEDEAKPHVHISPRGFEVRLRGTILPPIEGCPPEGPTVCTPVPADRLQAMLDEARALFLQQQNEPAQKLADEYRNSFDFRNLYNQMTRLKKDLQDSPDETWLVISADADVPYLVLIKTLDTLRFFLEHDHYETDEAFESARIRVASYADVRLFPEQELAAPRSSDL